MKRVKDLAFSELTLLAEDVDHDVEGVDGGSDPGVEHLSVDDPGLVELLELDEGGEQAVIVLLIRLHVSPGVTPELSPNSYYYRTCKDDKELVLEINDIPSICLNCF
ncbi:uncharacterized protein A4U43_C01F21710 [Asparagus officinalis]|uniref:Uncharacterized protein n=1 Tax=Asparagus officinalis TaxID=4686 RepID=A0A5P1FR47_ASPOF|nr:uncharacterized protein A4U43_C01F21710 [Asparagus officinalis]